MPDGQQLVPIPDPLDLDAAPFTEAYRRNLVKWAVTTTQKALQPDSHEDVRRMFPFAVYVLQYETALRAAEDRLKEAAS